LINLSYYNTTSNIYNVTFKPSNLTRCVTAYFGNPVYSNVITSNNFTINNGTQVNESFTGSSSWTGRNNVTNISVILVGGGGGGDHGGGGDGGSRYGAGGGGGNYSGVTTNTSISVVPGTSYPITVGAGGHWTTPTSDIYHDATSSTAFNNSSAAGGLGYPHAAGDFVCGNSATGRTGSSGYIVPGIVLNASNGSYSPTCPESVGVSGAGYGSGGGGGGGSISVLDVYNGGTGANGYVKLIYYVYDIPKYYVGPAPTSYIPVTLQVATIASSLNYVAGVNLMGGNTTSISVPRNGGILAAGTSRLTGTGEVYALSYLPTGFTTFYNATSAVGTSNTIACADSGVFYIEGRGSETDIYQLDGTLAGNYKTGGVVRSVDIASSNGLWAISGGDDGKTYIFSKATTSSWTVYYQSDTGGGITSVAMSDLGDYAAVGRSNGVFEYISTQEDSTSTNAYSANLFVNKGGSPYAGQSVFITEVSGAAFIANKTGTTDSTGKFQFVAYDGRTYFIHINNDEYNQTYMGSSLYPTTTVNIPVPVLTRPYTYTATFDGTTGAVTTTYNDVNNADVNIRIFNTRTNALVSSRDYIGVKTVNDVVATGDPTGTYKAVFNFTRTTGARYLDTVFLQSPYFNKIPQGTTDQYTLFIYAVYTILLMTISLAVGAGSIKYGVVMIVALTFAGIIFGFLPLSLYTAGIATASFIAMLEVFRRHD
jgi:hypothetical protein